MQEEKRFLITNVSGINRPGILATLTQIFLEHNVEIVDLQQSSLHDTVGLYFLVDLSNASDSKENLIKDLLFEASQLNLLVNYRLLSPDELRTDKHEKLYVLTFFGGTRALVELSKILKDENVSIVSISSSIHHGARSVEITINVQGALSLDRLKRQIMIKSRELVIDLALQRMEAYRKNKRLVFFDMDSTILDMEVIDEMARRAGVEREVSRITDKAMQGDFDFEESLTQRIALLKGLEVAELAKIRDGLPLSEGVEELVVTLKWLGYKLGIVSGGFDFFANHIKDKLGFDFVYANELEIKNGALTGRVKGQIIGAAEKARIVNQSSCDLGILLDQIVVVGDGANDALMLGQAGLGIAYNAKKKLDRVAGASLGKSRLIHIFHLLGITEEDITEAMSCKLT